MDVDDGNLERSCECQDSVPMRVRDRPMFIAWPFRETDELNRRVGPKTGSTPNATAHERSESD